MSCVGSVVERAGMVKGCLELNGGGGVRGIG